MLVSRLTRKQTVLPDGYRFPDVSHYRTVCDWSAYDSYPVSACKATEGASGKDSSFSNWRAIMRARNLFPVPYHFLRAGTSIASQVANYLESAADGKPFGVMLDVETAGDGSNPTIAQANAWFNEVQRITGIPRSQMLCYMPRWWYSAYGGGSTALKDTILHNSHFSLSPNISGYAGDKVEVIQYSSTAPIAGLCSPGTGDMNIAIGMTAGQFKIRLTEASDMPNTKTEIQAWVQEVFDRQASGIKGIAGGERPYARAYEYIYWGSRDASAVRDALVTLPQKISDEILADLPDGDIDAALVQAAAERAIRNVLGAIDNTPVPPPV